MLGDHVNRIKSRNTLSTEILLDNSYRGGKSQHGGFKTNISID